MDFPACFNTYNNINYRQKSQTLQPSDKHYLLDKFFASHMAQVGADRANYANVDPIDQEESFLMHHHHQPSRHHSHHHTRPHQHVHSRSHSQHYYHTMYQVNDLNNYYNISTIVPAITRSRRSPINEPPPPIHNPVAHLDCITVMQVCNELGNNIDSSPPMPNPRNYSILNTREGLFKVAFPQTRAMKNNYRDPLTGTVIKSGESVSVLGPSKDDRSKFTVCFNDKHIDLPHQHTLAPQITTRWN